MTHIVTLTPDPALDLAAHVDKLVPDHKLRCGPPRRDAGGGGINVARVIHRLGGDVAAIYPAGGGTGAQIAALLDRDGLAHRAVPVAGITRESFNVTVAAGGAQYRFILPGEALSPAECQACIDAVLEALEDGNYFVGSGGLAPGVPDDFYARVVRAAKAKGAITVIDSHGPALGAALDEGVCILKSSASELEAYLGTAPTDLDGWRDACAGLVRGGKAEIAIVTLGEQGAVLVGADEALHAAAPTVKPLTTVGAGDSFLAGLLFKLQSGATHRDALRTATAAGTAALLVDGTGLCDPAEIERLASEVEITNLRN